MLGPATRGRRRPSGLRVFEGDPLAPGDQEVSYLRAVLCGVHGFYGRCGRVGLGSKALRLMWPVRRLGSKA